MKKFLVAATALLITASAVQAQSAEKDNTTQGKHFQHKGFRHGGFAKLNLTDEQKAKMKSLNEDYRKQFADLKNSSGTNTADFKAKASALRKSQHEKMQSILTTEQKTQLAEQRKNMRMKMKNGRGDRMGKMKTQLGLSDEQAQKIAQSRAGFREKVKNIRQDQALSEDQKKEQVKALAKQHREEMKSVLTSEQLDKMKASMKGRGMSSK